MNYREPKEILCCCRICGKKPLTLDQINVEQSDAGTKICLSCAPVHNTAHYDAISGIFVES